MNTLTHITNKFKINTSSDLVEIPNTNRETLAQLFNELNFTVGAEIGVERGVYSDLLLKSNPKLFLYSIDAWVSYTGYREHLSQDQMDELMNDAENRLSVYGNRSVIVKGFSTDIVNKFEDNSLDFVYIDGNHEFTQVVNDISSWHKKVKVGGIVSGHDYILRRKPEYGMHVPHALHGFCNSYNIKPIFILGRKEKLEDELRENSRSWFYVKE